MIQSASIKDGGTLRSWQNATGQDFEIRGLPYNDGKTVHVIAYVDGEVTIMASFLSKIVDSKKVAFKQADLYERLKAAYQESGLFKAGDYHLKVVALDGDFVDIFPAPSENPIRLYIVQDEILSLTEGIPDVFGDSIPTVEGDPLPAVEG